MNANPTIDELLEIVEQRKRQLAACCGKCHHCRASVKILKAFEEYDASRLNDWPAEILVCEKCGSMTGVGKWGPDEAQIDLCQDCWQDDEGFHAWLEEEIRQALDESPEYELQPDGKTYKFIGEGQG